MSPSTALVEQHRDDGGAVVTGGGAWVIDCARQLADALAGVEARGASVRFDLSGVEHLDTTGAWLLERAARRLKDAGAAVDVSGLRDEQQALLDHVRECADVPDDTLEIGRRNRPSARQRAVSAVLAPGRAAATETLDFLEFVGLTMMAFGRLFTGRARVPVVSVVHHMQQVWINALPIVGILTFVVGGSSAFMVGAQLQKFEAEIFVINMIALAMLREIGVIVAAIVAAGRSGSAFAVELGTMKTREEVKAMRAMGIDPMEALVLPRVIAIVLTLPMLGFFGDVMGIIGGGLATIASVGVTPELFMERLSNIANLEMFLAGFVKTPVLGATIGIIGCWQGMRVEGGVEAMGRLTTRAVVQALFLVLLLDSLFTVFLNQMGL
ncbi:ABC transporter, inner membrane subunit [Caenispirillum salinarum AK4]|uniref:ABC transporter, inner membrane subunit n=1 Tax=Caenispirillum salinarum AK4 TaxID=1238182 RepID=K9GSG1_9PROT|nr:ABC transporter permease [Caenispirillum salinarum]EKV28097.1 ABC transporter, inner membrane subunit [Caenispirillum salinarum AK4]